MFYADLKFPFPSGNSIFRMGEIVRKNMLCWIIRKKIAVPLVGFVFHGEKTMIPYKEFDFLFNEITIPGLEFDFQTPWKSNSEKMRPFFFQKMQFPTRNLISRHPEIPIWKNSAVFFTLKVQFWKFPATSSCLKYQFQKIPAVSFSCKVGFLISSYYFRLKSISRVFTAGIFGSFGSSQKNI